MSAERSLETWDSWRAIPLNCAILLQVAAEPEQWSWDYPAGNEL